MQRCTRGAETGASVCWYVPFFWIRGMMFKSEPRISNSQFINRGSGFHLWLGHPLRIRTRTSTTRRLWHRTCWNLSVLLAQEDMYRGLPKIEQKQTLLIAKTGFLHDWLRQFESFSRCFGWLCLAGVTDVDGSAVSAEPQPEGMWRCLKNWKAKLNSHQDCHLGIFPMLRKNSDGHSQKAGDQGSYRDFTTLNWKIGRAWWPTGFGNGMTRPFGHFHGHGASLTNSGKRLDRFKAWFGLLLILEGRFKKLLWPLNSQVFQSFFLPL